MKIPLTGELSRNIGYFLARMLSARMNAKFDPNIICFDVAELDAIISWFALKIQILPGETKEGLLGDLRNCIYENLPDLSCEIEECEEEAEEWLDFYVSILDFAGFPLELARILSRPHVVLGHIYFSNSVFLISDYDLKQILNSSELPEYCLRMGWSSNKITHYCMSNAGNKISPRWIIEYLFDVKPVPPYQIFRSGVLSSDFMYDHSRTAIKLMELMKIPVMHGEKRGQKK